MNAEARSEFAGRTAVIATMHRKERAIAPLLESALNVRVQVPQAFDTDVFGTFTREVKRPADQRATARIKAQAVLDLTGETLAIASEGSFGPHPDSPLVPCNRELVLLLDQQHQLEIVGEVLSLQTNYRAQTVRSLAEAMDFAEAIGFPTHGLVVMAVTRDKPTTILAKGLTDVDRFQAVVEDALCHTEAGSVHLETDMRALYNPTRMQIIAQATEALLQSIAHRCPRCGCPGFNVIKRYPGLPCELCQTPTLLTRAWHYHCQHCKFEQVSQFPEGQKSANPANCPYCNP